MLVLLLIGLMIVVAAGLAAYTCCVASGVADRREEEMRLAEARSELARHQRIAAAMPHPNDACEGQGYAARKEYYDRWFDQQLNVEGWQKRLKELEVIHQVNGIDVSEEVKT